MTAQTQAAEIKALDTETLMEVTEGVTMEAKVKELEALSDEKLEDFYQQKADLNAQIAEMTATGNQAAIDAAEVQMANVAHEIAKREENMGLIFSSIGREMGMLQTLKIRMMEDSPEDITKRDQAAAAFGRTKTSVIDAKAAVEAAQSGKTAAEANLAAAEGTFGPIPIIGWDAFGKGEKVTIAKAALGEINQTLSKGPQVIIDAEQALAAAELNVDSVEEEIKVDKDHRLKSLSLDQFYVKLTDAEARISKTVHARLEKLGKAEANTKVELQFQRDLGVSTAEELQSLRTNIASNEMKLDSMKADLSDMVGQEDTPNYKKLENSANALATELDGLEAKKRLAEGKMSTAQVKVTGLEASMRAINSRTLLMSSNYNEFQIAASAARVEGANIAELLASQAESLAANSMSKGRDALTLAGLDTAIANENADRATMADDAGRRVNLLDEMDVRKRRGEKVAAGHDQRYSASAEVYRDKYGKLGTGGGAGGDGEKPTGGDDAGGERKRPELL
jgi:hypothetical protein